MAKGRYIKNAERACAGKAKFATAYEAEQTAEWRFRAYHCPVCHQFHLTSRSGAAATSPLPKSPVTPKEPGPRLGDLDWSAALDPQPKPPRIAKPKKPKPPPEPPARTARCLDRPGKDHRVRLVLDGVLVKSAPIRDARLRAALVSGSVVKVSASDPPSVIGVMDSSIE